MFYRVLQYWYSEENLTDVFSRAVETNDIETVKKCFEKKLDPNTSTHEGSTALQIVIEREFHELFELLISHEKIDINRLSRHGHSALHHACYLRKLNFVILLVRNHANVNIQDKFGKTPLHYAVIEEALDIAKYLLRHEADPNIHTVFGDTSLAIAVFGTKSLIMTQLLLKYGADVDVASSGSQHIFLQACLSCKSKKDLRFVGLFLKLGVDVNMREKICKKTALHYAAISNYAPLAYILLQNGADPNLTDYLNSTPLQDALKYDNVEVAFIISMFLDGELDAAIKYLQIDTKMDL